MPARASLGAFYGGPVWAAHKNAANATMVSSDNVRLLRPARTGESFRFADRPGPGSTAIAPGLIVATIYTLIAPAGQGFTAAFERDLMPELVASGVTPFALLETEAGANTFPRLPVREGEHAFVWFARFADVAAYDRWKAMLDGSSRWKDAVRRLLERHLQSPAEIWRLTRRRVPARSLSHCEAPRERSVAAALAAKQPPHRAPPTVLLTIVIGVG